MFQNERLNLGILVVVSLLLSIYLFFKTYVISMDGAFQYIPMAKVFVSGLLKDAIGYSGQQPLYSFLIALVSGLIFDFEVAGKLVSSIFGMLIIFPVYFLGKRIFDQKIAFVSALFLVIHPYIRRFSADVLKESTYLFFLATAIWFAWRTIQVEKRYPYLFIPLFSGLAYLVRPDGFEVLLVVFFYLLFIKKFDGIKKKWMIISLLILSSAVIFLPYLIHLREMTGTWTLSKAKSIAGCLGVGTQGGEVSLFYRIIYSFKKLNLDIFATFHPLYFFLLILGFSKRVYSHFKEGEKFLIYFIILHYVVLFLLILNFTDWGVEEADRPFIFSSRFVLPLLLFSIYWIGEGSQVIHNWICMKIESRHFCPHLGSPKRALAVWVILFLLIFAIILPKTLKPQRYERLPEKWAGTWIKNEYGRGMTIFTTLHRVAYYADGNLEYVDIKKDTIDRIKTSMVEKKALHFVVREREAIDFSKETIKKGFIELNRFEGKGMEKIIIYEIIH